MPKRPKYQRSASDFKRGTVAPWPSDKPPADVIATRARYIASGEHKMHASTTGLWAFGPKADKAKCDNFAESDWHQLLETLQEAIKAPCVDQEFRGDFPARAWAYVNGTLHEARLTNRATGQYHAFPLEYAEQYPEDPNDLLRNAPRVTIPVH